MSTSPPISGDGPPAQENSYDRGYIQPTLGHGLRIWWAFYWRNTLLSLIVMLAAVL